jgi:hypothetical protein
MFPEPSRPTLTTSRHFAYVLRGSGAYSQYKGRTRYQCEECVWVLHEAGGVGPLPRSARTTWRGPGPEEKLIMLCPGHVQLWQMQAGR